MDERILEELKVLNRLLAISAVSDLAKIKQWNEESESFILTNSKSLLAKIKEDCISDQTQE